MLLKDAFVASKPAKVKQYAEDLSASFRSAKIKTNDCNPVSKIVAVTAHLEKIRVTNNLRQQRKAFKQVSEDMLKLMSTSKVHDSAIYVQHCDCAENYKAASWLSYQEQIKNPFFVN
ncbi:MAG: Cu(I)/Ag(I) efflux system membrane fusion protein [Maribacter sp.]|jgi:Cu(I)/Ag(I) efflux system membrane fusion protein